MTAERGQTAGPDARSGSARHATDESSSRLVGDIGDDELDADEDDMSVPWAGADASAIQVATSLAPRRTRSPPPCAASLDPLRPPIG